MPGRLFVDLRNWFPHAITGVGQVARNATLAMLREAPETEFVLAAHPDVLARIQASNAILHPVLVGMGEHPHTEWFEQVEIPRLVRHYGATAFLSYEMRIPVRLPIPGATWVHDASIVRYPGSQSLRYRWFQRGHAALARRCADWIFVPSAFSAQECTEALGFEPSRIRVAPLGATGFDWGSAGSAGNPVRRDFLLMVGATNPRKNLERMLVAFAQVRTRHPDLRLHITGNPDEWRRIPGAADVEGVDFLGHLSDAELATEYQSCRGLVFPSLYEGFGIPLLDAWESGTPVACSRIAPFQGIVDKGVAWFDPRDSVQMESALEQLIAGIGAPELCAGVSAQWSPCAGILLDTLQVR